MLTAIARWLPRKWRLLAIDATLQAYPRTFNTVDGQLVLQHLIDNIYCTIYEGNNPAELAFHEGQRSVVHMILENIDKAAQPAKWMLFNEGAQNGVAS